MRVWPVSSLPHLFALGHPYRQTHVASSVLLACLLFQGFLPSATLLAACWAFLTLEAFLIADVNVGLMKKRQATSAGAAHGFKDTSQEDASHVISLRTMAEETLGPVGGAVSTATYIFLSYTLVVAYVAKAADVVTLGTDISFELASGVFVAALGGLVYAGNTQTTDWANRIMTGALLGEHRPRLPSHSPWAAQRQRCSILSPPDSLSLPALTSGFVGCVVVPVAVLFGVIVSGGLFEADWSQLAVQDWTQAPGTLPVLFLSLVFHDLIPGPSLLLRAGSSILLTLRRRVLSGDVCCALCGFPVLCHPFVPWVLAYCVLLLGRSVLQSCALTWEET